ncbi:hypothetical protein BX661DRAFT_171141 [Kickxella alabastrina]|uniref:uncharacterized protein n=1 Tax=Kickxella alabastrina TaxID=61397 RepID=UPI00221EF044|nr:uncharacterized protein BX661DRAFT_171141 [Kickxella alabastrina]KAI7827191.1 hypothetical protein BX661DRAFT_171141 [Kickxella alabastrina]
MIDRAAVTNGIKLKYGASLRAPWLDQCAQHVELELQQTSDVKSRANTVPLHIEAQIRLVLEQLLHSEIGISCFPSLVPSDQAAGVARLPASAPGTFLQIQEIIDVGVSKHALWEAVKEKEDFELRGIRPSYMAPATDDDESAATVSASATQMSAVQAQGLSGDAEREPRIPRGMLKLTLTDGKSCVSAIEMQPIPQLSAELPIGTKVLITAGQPMEPTTGTLCLMAGSIHVLGGAPAQYAQYTLRARLERLLDK